MKKRIKIVPEASPICYQHGDYRVWMVSNGCKKETGKRYWACPWPGCPSRACTDLEPLVVEVDESEFPEDLPNCQAPYRGER